jgi:hypothetical protein
MEMNKFLILAQKLVIKKNAKAPQRFLILNTLPLEINKF